MYSLHVDAYTAMCTPFLFQLQKDTYGYIGYFSASDLSSPGNAPQGEGLLVSITGILPNLLVKIPRYIIDVPWLLSHLHTRQAQTSTLLMGFCTRIVVMFS